MLPSSIRMLRWCFGAFYCDVIVQIGKFLFFRNFKYYWSRNYFKTCLVYCKVYLENFGKLLRCKYPSITWHLTTPLHTNTPFDIIWTPQPIAKRFHTTDPWLWTHLLTLITWRHQWWRQHTNEPNLSFALQFSTFCLKSPRNSELFCWL